MNKTLLMMSILVFAPYIGFLSKMLTNKIPSIKSF